MELSFGAMRFQESINVTKKLRKLMKKNQLAVGQNNVFGERLANDKVTFLVRDRLAAEKIKAVVRAHGDVHNPKLSYMGMPVDVVVVKNQAKTAQTTKAACSCGGKCGGSCGGNCGGKCSSK